MNDVFEDGIVEGWCRGGPLEFGCAILAEAPGFRLKRGLRMEQGIPCTGWLRIFGHRAAGRPPKDGIRALFQQEYTFEERSKASRRDSAVRPLLHRLPRPSSLQRHSEFWSSGIAAHCSPVNLVCFTHRGRSLPQVALAVVTFM